MAALLQHVSERPDGEAAAIDLRVARMLDQRAPGPDTAASLLRLLIDAGLDRIPLPGHGATLKRWQVLERVARHDLALLKLYESHVDALAILHEIDTRHVPRPGLIHAVWASESRIDPVTLRAATDARHDSSSVIVDGRKSWCSGARTVDVALMTAVSTDGLRHLVEVRLDDAGISIDESRWQAVGMRASESYDVVCDGVHGRLVGQAGDYLARPGFWHGGAGIAACWFGAAAAIGTHVRDLQVGREDVHALAHLGAIDASLASGAALLRECAHRIDTEPAADAARIALRARGAISDLCERVLQHATHAIGPGPLCNDAALARLVADLPIFIRQCRTDHDRVAQSRALLEDDHERSLPGWLL